MTFFLIQVQGRESYSVRGQDAAPELSGGTRSEERD